MNAKRRRILFVDDDANFLGGIRRTLHNQRHAWDMVFVPGVDEALVEIEKDGIDVIVTDVKMPGKDGFKVLQAIHDSETHRNVPVILLTGHGDAEMKSLALSLGAHDLLIKPIAEEDLLARLRAAIHLKGIQDELKEMNATLERKVAERTVELERSRLEIIWRLANAVERRDGHTENHIVRVGCCARLIGESIGLPRETVRMLFLATPLHDIGKIAIPDSILQKPGPLTDEEHRAMRKHCEIGSEMLLGEARGMKPYLEWLGRGDSATPSSATDNRFLSVAATIAMTHHERWDGGGYPLGLAGDKTPLEGRIAAVADVFDALCSKRPYSTPMPENEACALVRAESGRQFDRDVVAAFTQAIHDIRAVRAQFPDEIQSS